MGWCFLYSVFFLSVKVKFVDERALETDALGWSVEFFFDRTEQVN